jgi:(p)ppGpp synthase/HD superfamily hydrolase
MDMEHLSKLSLISRAREFATIAHKEQLRKYTNEPYVVHCIEVAGLVASMVVFTDQLQVMTTAALLHDVLEDQPHYSSDLYHLFPKSVTDLVEDLTEVKYDVSVAKNRKERKLLEAKRLSETCRESQTIKCADLISNTKSIVEHDPKFARLYLQEAKWLLINLTKADDKLRGTAWMQVLQAEHNLKNNYFE